MIGVNDIEGIRITTPLIDFTKAIGEDGFENRIFSEKYPAVIDIHQERPAVNVPLHWHEGAELIYSRNWNLTMIVNAQRYFLAPGEFFLISPCALHAIYPEREGSKVMEVMSVTLDADALAKMDPDVRYCEISKNAPGVTEETCAKMTELCEKLYLQAEKDEERNVFIMNSILFEIVQMIMDRFWVKDAQGPKKVSMRENRMKSILEYINENYKENLTTQSLAEHFGYNREYFCRIFKRYSNMTFKEYLVDIRLKAVVKEMRHSRQACSKIAIAQGFPDTKGFNRAFQKHYGMSPGQYRKEHIDNAV